MAELPRYRRDGLLSAVSPGFEGVGLREAARASETLTRAMDRVSQMAFQVAGEQAKIEGIEYGAANAPTAQQLATAKASGKDLEDLLPGDTFSIFGSAARSTALEIIGVNIEKEARESISALQVGYEAGTVSLPALQEGLATIEDSYSAVLQDISPAAAAKFRASISLAGNSAFLAAAKAEAAKMKADNETTFIAYIDQKISDVDNVVSVGGTMSPDGEFTSADEHISVLREQITNAGLMLDDPTLTQTKLTALDKAVSAAKVNTVVSSVRFEPSKGLLALQGKATLPDAEAQVILNSMDESLKQQVFEQLQSAQSAKLSLEAQENTADERRMGEKAKDSIIRLVEARRRGDIVAIDDAMEELQIYDIDKYESYAKAIYVEGGVDNEDIVATLTNEALNNRLTESMVNDARASGHLTLGTYTTLLGKVDASRDESYRRAVNHVKRQIGYPDKAMFNASSIDRRAVQEVNAIEDALFIARRENPDLDAYAFVVPLIQEARDKRRAADSMNKASAAFNRASRRFKDMTAEEMLQKYQELPESPQNKTVIDGLQLYIEMESELQ